MSQRAASAEATPVAVRSAGPMLGRPGDRYEEEAERIAEQVTAARSVPLAGPLPVTPLIQRQAEEDKEEEEEPIQARSTALGPVSASATARATHAVAEAGRPLPPVVRGWFEPRFGRDLGHVRLHTSAIAQAAAGGIHARAFTLGSDIAFAAGQYAPDTAAGRRLLAHEITHTLQQGARVIRRDEGDEPAPVAPTRIDFNFDPAMAIPAAAGGAAALTATTDGSPNTWSIVAGTAAVAASTAINEHGAITLAADQVGGTLTVHAENDAGSFERPFSIASVPTGIESTAFSSDLTTATTEYGAAFQHTFTSAAGSQDVLQNLRVGERFPGVATPNASTHVIGGAAWPFGRGHDSFTLSTGTRNNDGSGGWALDDTGQFGPAPAGSGLADGDNVGTQKSGIQVGDHVQSHSNPHPRNRLPVTLTLDQEFHFYNPRAASGSRWTQFTTTAHSRTLRRSGTDVEFVTTVNGVEHVQDYEGKPAVTNLTASPANTPKSTPPPAPPSGGGGGGTTEGGAAPTTPAAPTPAPRTVILSVETLPGTLPTGTSLDWSIVGDALGCTITPDPSDPTRATLTIGTTAGTVTAQVAENTGTNSDRATVRIT